MSIAKIGDLAQAGSKFTRVGLLPGAGQKAVDLELSEELAARPLARASRPIQGRYSLREPRAQGGVMATEWGSHSISPGSSAGWFFSRPNLPGFLPVLQVMPLSPSFANSD